MNPETQKLHDDLAKKLTDEGRLIAAGFEIMRAHIMAPNAPQMQVDEMRLAFMAGAQHLYASMMALMSAGDDVAEADMHRMSKIDAELACFAETVGLQFAKTGRAQ